MELLLKDGDYVPDGKGGFLRALGTDEILQKVLFQLTARRGCFPFLPGLGSRLYLLPREKAGDRAALARQYAAEALSGEPELEVIGVDLRDMGNGALELRVALDWKGKRLETAMIV